MERLGNLKGKEKMISKEIIRFRKLIKGHEKLLNAIGNL